MDRVGDEVLVKRVASGDERALSDLYDRYAGLVYGSGMRLLGDRGTSEELVQDVFTSCGETRPVSTRPGRALRPGSTA
jgi:DNA-directed RNA polymerase specialized sigma24 family protein